MAIGNVKPLAGRIVPDTVHLYGEVFWREQTIDRHFGELVDAGRELVAVLEAAGLLNLANGVQLGPIAWYVKANEAVERLSRACGEVPAKRGGANDG